MIGPSFFFLTMVLIAPGGDMAGAPIAQTQSGPVSCEELLRFAAGTTSPADGDVLDGGDASREVTTLQDLVIEKQLITEAKKAGLDRDPGFAATWSNFRKQILLEASESVFAAGIEIPEKALRDEYTRNRDRYRRPARINSRFILLRLPDTADQAEVEKARARLQKIREELLAGASFVTLAAQYSEAENATRGGAVAASPRGTLLEAYETVAWELKPGEVSDITRLPDGLALIYLESIFPEFDRTFEQVRKGIHEKLFRNAVARRRDSALAEARALWPTVINQRHLWSGDVNTRIVMLSDEGFSLQDLGLDNRPPRLEERVNRAVEDLLLVSLAEKRGLNERPDVAARLIRIRNRLLANIATEKRLAHETGEEQERRFQAWYSKHRMQLKLPERRTFAAVVVAGEEGRMRPAFNEALDIERTWRSTGKVPQDHMIERWGPFKRAVLGNSTSAQLTQVAFSLELDEVSAPLRLERYSADRARFIGEGYAVLRMLAVETARTATADEARGLFSARPDGKLSAQLEGAIRARALAETGLEVYDDELLACWKTGGQPESISIPEPSDSPDPG